MSLRGCMFSVSVKSEQNQSTVGSEELNYASLTSDLVNLGGKISNTVHKRVTFVVATKRAVSKETQRVRKAAKLGIQILDAESVADACHAGTIKSVKDLDAFVVEFTSERVTLKRGKRKRSDSASSSGSADFENNKEPVRTVDLGCCCSCHDAGESSCSWCVDHHVPSALVNDVASQVAEQEEEAKVKREEASEKRQRKEEKKEKKKKEKKKEKKSKKKTHKEVEEST